jgi:hypothetical protein
MEDMAASLFLSDDTMLIQPVLELVNTIEDLLFHFDKGRPDPPRSHVGEGSLGESIGLGNLARSQTPPAEPVA